jgi:mannose-6-phosphate isomerase-like protein (cupin superfamily)
MSHAEGEPIDSRAGYRQKAIDEMESIWGGSYKRVRGELGVTAFGLGVLDLPPDIDRIPRHVHSFDGQEEVYIPLAGSGTLEVGSESVPLDTSTAVLVGPNASRTVTSGPDGIRVLIVGGTPGKAYAPFAPLELGAPEPNPAELPGIKAMQGHESTDDFTSVKIDPATAYSGHRKGVTFHPVGRALGTSAFGLSMVELDGPEVASDYPLHSHVDDNQVEVFVVAEGAGEMLIGEQTIAIAENDCIAVEPQPQRTLRAGTPRMRFFVIGAPDGAPYGGSSPTMS